MFEGHANFAVHLGDEGAPHDLVHPVGAHTQFAQLGLQRMDGRIRRENVGERCSMVTCATASAKDGIKVAAVAPEPMTTTRLPVQSSSCGQCCGCTLPLEITHARPLGRIALA